MVVARYYMANTDAPHFVDFALAYARTNPAIAAAIISLAAPQAPPAGAPNANANRGGRGGWPDDKPVVLTQVQWDAMLAAARSAPPPSTDTAQGGRGGGRGGFQMQPSDLYPALARLAARWGKPELIPPRQ
jgi:hypothetical protein